MEPKVGKKTPGSGRKPGTPNKKTQTLMEICDQEGLDPFRALLKLAKTAEKEEIALGALKELCQYLYPKRKALEIANSDDAPAFKVVIEDFTK